MFGLQGSGGIVVTLPHWRNQSEPFSKNQTCKAAQLLPEKGLVRNLPPGRDLQVLALFLPGSDIQPLNILKTAVCADGTEAGDWGVRRGLGIART